MGYNTHLGTNEKTDCIALVGHNMNSTFTLKSKSITFKNKEMKEREEKCIRKAHQSEIVKFNRIHNQINSDQSLNQKHSNLKKNENYNCNFSSKLWRTK